MSLLLIEDLITRVKIYDPDSKEEKEEEEWIPLQKDLILLLNKLKTRIETEIKPGNINRRYWKTQFAKSEEDINE